MRNSLRPCVASASISFSEMISITACPRCEQHFADGEAGKQMPAGAAGRDDEVHELRGARQRAGVRARAARTVVRFAPPVRSIPWR